MEKENHWREQAKCKRLTPKEADALFFTGPGGKPHQADKYCADCPILSMCLQEAIDGNYKGFWAGTSDSQRWNYKKVNRELAQRLADAMPVEPVGRKIYLKVFTSPDYHAWMDEVEPTDEELLLLEAV